MPDISENQPDRISADLARIILKILDGFLAILGGFLAILGLFVDVGQLNIGTADILKQRTSALRATEMDGGHV